MPSVASEPHVFPPARTLPDLRPSGAHDLIGFGAEPGGFAKLLDSEHESRTTPDRDDAGPAKSSRRSNAAHAKHAKDKAPAQDQAPADATSQAAAEETPEDAAQQASSDTPKDADQQTSEAAAEATPNGETTEAGTDPSTATVAGAALADALFPVTTSATPVAAMPAAAPTVAADAPLPVPTIAAAEAAPVAAPSSALPAQAVQAPVTPAGATSELSAAKPVTQPATAQPAKAQPQSSAPGETPGQNASPAQAKPAVSPAQPIAHDEAQPRPDNTAASQQNRAAERAPVAIAETTADPIARASDAAGAVKAGADLVQSLGVTAPAPQVNTAPMQSTAAAAAAAAAAPTPAQAAPVPVSGLAVEIAAQSLAGKNRFEIRLDPPELGRIDVRLEIDNDGHVKSRLVVERSETLDLLRRDAPQLERALQQAGLKTGDNALEFSLRHQAPHRDDETHQNAARLVVPDDGTSSLDAVQQNYGRQLGLGGGIDIRV